VNAEHCCGALHQNPELLLSHSTKVSYSNLFEPVNSLLSHLGKFPAPTEWDSQSHATEASQNYDYLHPLHPRIKKNKKIYKHWCLKLHKEAKKKKRNLSSKSDRQ